MCTKIGRDLRQQVSSLVLAMADQPPPRSLYQPTSALARDGKGAVVGDRLERLCLPMESLPRGANLVDCGRRAAPQIFLGWSENKQSK